ncbi:glycosyltransferase family 4 protein [Halovivax sp.]|uniref:glycosyltransferase family 4 protein n=1 Tax=Halovivax sp. TaxID=1935978 RepID=UPI0025C54137|nr:glycosyltransferase [Halovivax sp.]
MRVVFVSVETVHHRETETTARLQTVVELLRDAGHDVHVCCARWWEDGRDALERDGVSYHGVTVEPEAGRSFLVRLPFVVRALGPDVVHVAAEPPAQVRAAGLATRLSRAPLVVEWYGAEGVDGRWATRRAAARADRILAPSRLVRTWVRELGVDGDRVGVVPNPIDVDAIRGTEPTGDADVVYARRLDEGANLESLLLALAEVRTRDWTATVIGDGPRRGEYEALASDLRIADRIDFVGAASREEKIAIYRGGHVFAQTAEFCVFPTELAWALAAGCVGVVEYHADSSGHELIEGRERGFRTTSETELAEAIARAGRMDRRDLDETFADFDRGAVRERYLETYRELRESSGLFS